MIESSNQDNTLNVGLDFMIYPHKGYLNTSFCLYSNKCADIKDLYNSKVYHLDKDKQLNIHLEYGIHTFINLNNLQRLDIIVEDAFRFGGSTINYVFCSSLSPWIICVLKDRMYFHNIETQEEYVENGITPDKIEDIDKNHVLFQSDNGNINSIYSLIEHKEILKFTTLLYNKNGNVICEQKQEKNKAIYNWNPYVCSTHIYTDCSIEEPYLCIKTDTKVIVEKIGEKTEGKVIQVSNIDISNTPSAEHFISFIKGTKLAVFAQQYENRISVRIKDALTNKALFYKLYYNTLIEYINNCQIENFQDLREEIESLRRNLKEKVPKLYVISSIIITTNWIKLQYLYWNSSILSICTDCTNIQKIKGEVTNSQSKILNAKTDKVLLQCDHHIAPSDIVITENFLIIKYQGSCKYYINNNFEINEFNNSKGFLFENKFYFTKNVGNRIELYNETEDLIYKTYDEIDFSLFESYGIINNRTRQTFIPISRISEHGYNGETYTSYYNCNNPNVLFYSTQNAGSCIISNGIKYRRQCPPNINDKQVFISSDGNNLVSIIDRKVILFRWHIDCLDIRNSRYIKEETPLWQPLFNFETFEDAWFDNSGNCYLYDSQNNVYKYYNVQTNETIEFQAAFIKNKKGWNSYKPLCNFDYNRNPVFKDPCTQQPINTSYLKDFHFISPDCRYSAENSCRIEYFNKATKEYIDEKEYDKVKKYFAGNFPIGTVLFSYGYDSKEEVEKRRRDYINKHKNYFYKEFKTQKEINDLIDNATIFIDSLFSKRYYLHCEKIVDCINGVLKREFKLKLSSDDIWFINYVSFSYDSKYVAVAGKTTTNNGFVDIFDLTTKQRINTVETHYAVWLVAYSQNGYMAYYTSTPDTNVVSVESSLSSIQYDIFNIPCKNFLTFSPSGRLCALSSQGYIPYTVNPDSWRHTPSCDLYIYKTEELKQLFHFNDHGDNIKGVGIRAGNIASVSFSLDETKVMSVSEDGVVVIRNLKY